MDLGVRVFFCFLFHDLFPRELFLFYFEALWEDGKKLFVIRGWRTLTPFQSSLSLSLFFFVFSLCNGGEERVRQREKKTPKR